MRYDTGLSYSPTPEPTPVPTPTPAPTPTQAQFRIYPSDCENAAIFSDSAAANCNWLGVSNNGDMKFSFATSGLSF